MTELKTEIKVPRLTIDERPTWLPLVQVQGRWRVDALGRYWSPRMLALALLALAGTGWALWQLTGGTR